MRKKVVILPKKVLIVSILISAVLLASLFVYAAVLNNWDGGYRFSKNTGTSLTVHYGNADGTSSPAASCWKLYKTSTSTNDIFVPTKKSGEISSFINKAGVLGFTVSSAATNGVCNAWGTCNANPTCVSSNKCSGTLSGSQSCTSSTSPSCGGSAAPSSQSCAVTCTSSDCNTGEYCSSGSCLACQSESQISCGTTLSCGGTVIHGTKCSSSSQGCTGSSCANCWSDCIPNNSVDYWRDLGYCGWKNVPGKKTCRSYTGCDCAPSPYDQQNCNVDIYIGCS